MINKSRIFVLLIAFTTFTHSSSGEGAKPQVNALILKADFTDTSNKIGPINDFFDVAVRTDKASPHSKPANLGQTPQVNTVRILGGWASKDIEGDAYKWDGEKFVYDFHKVTNRIDRWLNNGWEIFQIVLDNPPWAFQRGMKFVEEPNGTDYLLKDANSVYGNGLPPNDSVAWHNFIGHLLQHLVKKYGKETVSKWRFRVGSEIDTRPQHWVGTRTQFFEHYRNTVSAVRSVLPNASVGAHFRESSFQSRYVDYTGNTEDAYAPHFIAWAKANNVPYDFVAISYYPHIHKEHELDMQRVYKYDFAPIAQHPDWNTNASLEIHEFKLISKMQRAGFVSVSTSHSSSFFAMLAKFMLNHNIKEIFQWGTGHDGRYAPEVLTQFALLPMVGNQLYRNSVHGQPSIEGNLVDGIFSKRPDSKAYDILLYNFNRHNLAHELPEINVIDLDVSHPVSTPYQFRIGTIDKRNNAEEMFIAAYPKARIPIEEGGWWNERFHPTASGSIGLNAEGKQVYLNYKHKYQESNMIIWGDWQTGKTSSGNNKVSRIQIESEIGSFSVQKIEIRVLP
ncbi:hypothetical protein Q4574_08430 [Aliiglaciecola sp. 3_MG-2023]|uniref:GH39 family glycosyl hydrolase n=1 Tax=Aliiglaciecola sp. 3_MG-2023 TaxID=3062644 RepID=UPI0026E48A4C|nr:hypothetical protein [Aliiglaciecola sp. 3_MG-2023]MDO6693308.1 hypothetical protein [Aliiglaciecola sp. 3_MG-2023]